MPRGRRQGGVDLWLATALAAGAATAVTLAPEQASGLRTALAFAGVLLAPGYALQVLLFPHRDHLTGPERLALSLGLSIVALPPIGAAVAAWDHGIPPTATAWALAGTVAALSLAAAARRAVLPRGARAAFTPATPGFGTVAAALVLTFAAAGGVVALSAWLAPSGPETEFYVLGPEGTLEGYGGRLAPGEAFTLTAGVANHTAVAQRYRLRFPFADNPDVSVGPVAPGASWEGEVSLTAPEELGCVRLPLLLLREDGTSADDVHRRLQLHRPVLAEATRAPWEVCR